MRYAILAGLAILAGCGGDSPTEPPPPPPPTSVVIRSVTAVPIYQGTRVTLDLQNTGGAGGFKIRAVMFATMPNQPGATVDSETYPVVANWRETVTYEISHGTHDIYRLIVFSHSEGSLQYRETSRHTFECCI